MDGPGELKQGTFDYRFNFKNVDLDVDSYCGIALDVRFEVSAEMVY
jgi:transposase